jgi:hypothetical protein
MSQKKTSSRINYFQRFVICDCESERKQAEEEEEEIETTLCVSAFAT